ncbi:MAG: hypothetical protein OEM46_02855 [Ignavibacteria bacterium]|nr:hypothetical protein [Ignavibacteria bacterium]
MISIILLFANVLFFSGVLNPDVLSHLYDKDMKINMDKVEIGPDYYPIDPSLKLVYNSSLGEASAVIKKEGNNFIMDLRNDDFFFVQTVYVENDTVYMTKLDQEVDVFLFISSGSSVTYNRPYLRFPFPLSINDNWNWNGVEYIDGEDPDTILVSGKVLGQELVETEAGNFDCVKFQIDIRKKKSGSHTKFFEWRTPKIGLVKLEAFIDSKGFIGTIINLLGYDEMKFELKKVG